MTEADPAETVEQAPAGPELDFGQQGLIPVLAAIDYRVRLTQEARDKLGLLIKQEYDNFRTFTNQRRENVRQWRRDWEMYPADDAGPWANSSAIRGPITRTTCLQHAQALNDQICNADPVFGVLAKDPSTLPFTRLIEEALNSVLREAGFEPVAREVHHELSVAGNCLVRCEYVRETVRAIDHALSLNEQQVEQFAQNGANPQDALIAGLELDANGKAKIGVQFVDRVVKDGVEFGVVPLEDMVVFPAMAKHPDHLWGLGERTRLRGMDLLAGAKAKRYIDSEVRDLLKLPGDSVGLEDEHADQQELAGVEPQYGPSEPSKLHESYEVLLLDYLGDLDGDDLPEWYQLVVALDTGRVLQVQYLPYEHGRSRYTFMRYFTRTGNLWGGSVAELVATAQAAISSAANNHGNLEDMMVGLATMFFYDSRSGLTPDKIKITPGGAIEVDNVDGIKPMIEHAMAIPGAMAACRDVMALYKEWSDLLTGTSNPTLGRETSTNKTLGEVQLVVGAAQQRAQDAAKGVALQWKGVVDRARWITAQANRHTNRIKYRVTASADKMLDDGQGGQQAASQVWQIGEDGTPEQITAPGEMAFSEIPAEMLARDVELVPGGLGLFADAQTRIQRAMLLLKTMSEHPLTAGSVEVQALVLNSWLHDLNVGEREKIMQEVWKQIEAQRQAQMMQEQMAQMQMQQQGQVQQAQMGMQQEQQAQAGQMQQMEQQRAQEQHVLGMLQGVKALTEPAANGKSKK